MTHTDRKRPMSEPHESSFSWGTLSLGDGYLLVCLQSLPSEEVAQDALRRIDAALVASGLRRVMLDSQELPAPLDAINRMYWEWAEAGKHHDRLAILVRSDMKRVQGNMSAVAKQIQLRSFHSQDEAEQWLNTRDHARSRRRETTG